ncbi:HoxN/HupN/NixA family nickel/cobalt transporter [Sulfolobus acidocaldarius]|uniref:Nickel/cobalt efflux system n=4 Tax=Sulfolobus acidocaldarius TaxID=2285 RepID=Q4J7A7_SULAC|nr:HoxN/HupN/NixA family nickel/cobalt transporter [Sulfolobus acidocaldarius]AAY81324.1 conserved nickel transporter [Sulfolobus acidocaldarius DSM 639]AGE71965.1 nickel transporter [Sulfolobus acidocaldarius N8]AGE74237.1 nickel transporter [Sulfolobus acidocaldarius Ron12/I]ALU29874.1 nickel transporter [Sulfolobus acidocaldarius]ALU32614.1 nickel transporter [Sulfolobus acidocaldarius]
MQNKNTPFLKLSLFFILELVITTVLFIWLDTLSSFFNSSIVFRGSSTTLFALGVLAYVFGLRHAVDADHLAAIDNTTRKLVQENKPSTFTGLFFSLGHSTIVIVLSLVIMLSSRLLDNISSIQSISSTLSTLISGFFLYIIGFLNFLVVLEIYGIFKQVKSGKLDEGKLNEVLLRRGFMNRFFGKLFKIVDSQYHLYVIGFLFGLGFDTATETALLAISASSAVLFSKVPLWYLLVYPLLFTAGMTLVDTTDGLFMNGAYKWAFLGNPLRKVWYNLSMTLISIIVAFLVGTLEILGLLQSEFNFSGPFWSLIDTINSDVWWENVGIIIIGSFALAWIFSFLLYKVKIQRYEYRPG